VIACLLVTALLLALGAVAVWRGWCADSRDPDYTMGRVLGFRPWQRHDPGQPR
jgi:hypothetical protein